MKKSLFVLAVALMMFVPVKNASAGGQAFVEGGPVFPGGWYAPYLGPYWGPSYGYYRFYYPDVGEVHLETKCKTARCTSTVLMRALRKRTNRCT